ncbi:MAG: hypothetical protein Ct9H90mP22_1370 [Gammaproteobacteria bacterium]|nr:MAG: hypothetical protein Ct9H90mP22_1370 [Gammaproteobacteria bacterium]
MYTANTMASAVEALGMSFLEAAVKMLSQNQKKMTVYQLVKQLKNLLESDIKPSDIMTREAFENAITVFYSTWRIN